VTLSESVRVIRRQFAVVIAALVATSAVAAAIAWSRTAIYEAHSQLFVAIGGVEDLDAAYQAGLSAQERARSYAQLISTAAMTEAVADELGLPDGGRGLEGKLQASVPVDSVLINVTASDPSARRAADLANAAGRRLPQLVATLEGGREPGAGPTLTPKVASPAEPPSSPASPRRPVYVAFGLLFGGMLGVVAAFLREHRAGRVRTERDAEAIVGAAVIGKVSGRSDVGSPTSRHGVSSALEEEYWQLSATLAPRPRSAALRLVVTSAARGEGKTSVAANLAIAFAVMSRRVTLVDANLRRPGIAQLLDLVEAPGLTDVLSGLPLGGALQEVSAGEERFRVLTAGADVERAGDVVFSPALAALLTELETTADVLIVDTAAVLEAADAAALTLSGNVLLVTRLGATLIPELAAAVQHLELVGASIAGVVATGAPHRPRGASAPRPAMPEPERRPLLGAPPRTSERRR
jgi:succinoglycan biosynthesis transport protein ExoP